MSNFTVKTGAGDTEQSVTVSYDVPTTLADMVQKYGEATVHEFAERAVAQAVQNIARVALKSGASPEAIQKSVTDWVPGVRGPVTRKSAFERASTLVGNLSAEELAALLAKVKAAEKAAAKGAH